MHITFSCEAPWGSGAAWNSNELVERSVVTHFWKVNMCGKKCFSNTKYLCFILVEIVICNLLEAFSNLWQPVHELNIIVIVFDWTKYLNKTTFHKTFPKSFFLFHRIYEMFRKFCISFYSSIFSGFFVYP